MAELSKSFPDVGGIPSAAFNVLVGSHADTNLGTCERPVDNGTPLYDALVAAHGDVLRLASEAGVRASKLRSGYADMPGSILGIRPKPKSESEPDSPTPQLTSVVARLAIEQAPSAGTLMARLDASRSGLQPGQSTLSAPVLPRRTPRSSSDNLQRVDATLPALQPQDRRSPEDFSWFGGLQPVPVAGITVYTDQQSGLVIRYK